MTRAEWFSGKFLWLKRFFIAAIVGVVGLVASSLIAHTVIKSILIVIFVFSFLPLLFMLVFIPIIHWKDRYKGKRSNLWAVFLVFETSGWSKIFYWFMHIIPDKNRTGIYSDVE